MRKLKIIEHISLDGVIQMTSGPEDDFPYGDWTAPYRERQNLISIASIALSIGIFHVPPR